MKKIALAFVIAAVAASPAMAKKAKRAHHPVVVASANSNENSWNFVRDGFPVFLPSWSIPVYLAAKNQH
jgi:hypothetical protein